MEEEDKDRILKAREKPSTIPSPVAKPRPLPRPRNQLKGANTTQNEKPERTPPKPVLLPKPRRPPPTAPSPNDGVTVTNNNESPIDKRPLVKPRSVTETSKNISSSSDLPASQENINNVETRRTENGRADSMDDEWYEPLRRPRRESASSSSEDAGSYEDMIKIDKYEDSQASTPRSVFNNK